MENVCLCGKTTKYRCIRYEKTSILKMNRIISLSKVRICSHCNNTARNQPRTSSRDETEVESALADLKASDESRPVQFKIDQRLL